MVNEKSIRIILISVAVALFLWATFNNLDLAVKYATKEDMGLELIIYSVTQLVALTIMIYYGATKRLFPK